MTNGTHGPRPEAKATAKDRLLQTIAILGLIAILLLGAWGIIQLAFNLPGVFSSVGSSLSGLFSRTASSTLEAREALNVVVPQSVTNGEAFTLSWRHDNPAAQYSYTVSYSCVNGVSMKAPLPTGAYQTVACNTPFNYTNSKDKVTIMPSVTTPGAKVTFTVSAVRLSNNQVALSGSAQTTANTKSTATSNTAGTYYAGTQKSSYFGYGDLAVRINSVNPLYYQGLTSVTFTIQNAGTNVVYAGWSFEADLPIDDGHLYRSAPQQVLYPGDAIVYTLTFENDTHRYNYDRYDRDWDDDCEWDNRHDEWDCEDNWGDRDWDDRDNRIRITADPYNQVLEQNEFNNTASVY